MRPFPLNVPGEETRYEALRMSAWEASSEILLNVPVYTVCHARYEKPLKKLALVKSGKKKTVTTLLHRLLQKETNISKEYTEIRL